MPNLRMEQQGTVIKLIQNSRPPRTNRLGASWEKKHRIWLVHFVLPSRREFFSGQHQCVAPKEAQLFTCCAGIFSQYAPFSDALRAIFALQTQIYTFPHIFKVNSHRFSMFFDWNNQKYFSFCSIDRNRTRARPPRTTSERDDPFFSSSFVWGVLAALPNRLERFSRGYHCTNVNSH